MLVSISIIGRNINTARSRSSRCGSGIRRIRSMSISSRIRSRGYSRSISSVNSRSVNISWIITTISTSRSSGRIRKE